MIRLPLLLLRVLRYVCGSLALCAEPLEASSADLVGQLECSARSVPVSDDPCETVQSFYYCVVSLLAAARQLAVPLRADKSRNRK